MNRLKANISKGADLKNEWDEFLQSESEPAFKSIYNHYYHYLSLIGAKRGFAEDRVQDCIHELFLYVWENRKSLLKVLHYHNYLITSFIRKLYKNNGISSEDISELSDLPQSLIVPSPESTHIYNNMTKNHGDKLKKVIENLPERQRLMIYQKFYLDLSYNEIAELNNISINTVYNTIYKAIFNLKSNLGDEGLLFLAILSALITFFYFF